MRNAVIVLGTAALAAASTPLAAQGNVSVFDSVSDVAAIDSTTQAEDVKFRDDGAERMTVPVQLSGQGPYRFLVDTGADRTALSTEVADKLQLKRGDAARLHSVAGVQEVQTVTVPSLRLTSESIRVANAPLLSEFHMGADGILGVDSLRSQRVMFDFKANTMSVVPSVQKLLPEDKGAIVVTARRRNGRLVLTSARVDDHNVAVVLDTGSQVTIGNNALRSRLLRGDRRAMERLGTVRLRSVTGDELFGEYMVVRKLEIGGATLTNLSVVFADAHTFRQLKLDKGPAMLLGMNAMRAFDRVSIDFANKKVRLMLPEHSSSQGVMFASRLPW
ncbi:MAG TPA: retroviral-like aspartic protease family protein [Sphingomicrobium sp.]|nr:retroviral-like aspartic protease family protein [Sphingomicrobium sp.]